MKPSRGARRPPHRHPVLVLALLAPLLAHAAAPYVPTAVDSIAATQDAAGLVRSPAPLADDLQTTARVAEALSGLPGGAGIAASASAALAASEPANTQERAQILLLGEDATVLADLQNAQNDDGSFGAAPGYTGNVLDTALALSALRARGEPVGVALREVTIPAGGNLLVAVELPTDVESLETRISSFSGSPVQVWFAAGAPPGNFGSFFTISAGPVVLPLGGADGVAPGVFYLDFRSTGGSTTLSFTVDWFAPTRDSTALTGSVAYLLEARNGDGGWGFAPADDNSQLYYTYWATRALGGLTDLSGVDAFVLNRQRAGGGFADGPVANVFDTSVAIVTLGRLGLPAVSSAPEALPFLTTAQDFEGDFEMDPYRTAWALAAGISSGAPPSRALELYGTAAGGSVDVLIDGTTVSVPTTSGQTAEQVLADLAQAVADALGETGVTSLVQGNRLLIGGSLEGTSIADAGLSENPPVDAPSTAQVPSLPPGPLAVAAGLLLLLGLRLRSATPGRP